MMQGSPAWEPLETLAHTLSYDVALHGPGQSMTDVLAAIAVPSLVLAGGAGDAWMQDTARAVAAAVPGARHCTIEGEDHGILHHPRPSPRCSPGSWLGDVHARPLKGR